MYKNIVLAFAAVAFSACGKVSAPVVDGGEPEPAKEAIELLVGVSLPGETKAVPSDELTEGESKVNSIQVFVFDENGILEGHARQVSGTGVVPVSATAGPRIIRAVVNDPEDIYEALSEKGTKTVTQQAFLAFRHRLEDNRPGNFIMFGAVSVNLKENCGIDIEVKRAACRIELQKVSASLRDFRRNWSVSINSIFLVNVAADEDFAISGDPVLWANKLGWESGHAAYDALLYDKLYGVSVKNNVYEKDGQPVKEEDAYRTGITEYDLAPGVVKVKDNSYKVSHVFYPYPNSYFGVYEPEWSPRGTMLVLEATMIEDDGATPHHGWYAIPILGLENNHKYTIQEIMLMHPPAPVSYAPISTGDAFIRIKVEDWEVEEQGDFVL